MRRTHSASANLIKSCAAQRASDALARLVSNREGLEGRRERWRGGVSRLQTTPEALLPNRPSEIDLVGAGERAGAGAAERKGRYAADSD